MDWGNNPLITIAAAVTILGGIVVTWRWILGRQRPLLVKFDRLDYQVHPYVQEVLDVVRGDRNKLVSLVRSSEAISKHPDSFEIANAVAQALKKEYAEKIPPRHPLSWSATTVDLTIENTGSETQRNVALSIDSAYCFLIVRGENRSSVNGRGEIQIGDVRAGDIVRVCSWGDRAGLRKWLKVTSDTSVARLNQQRTYWHDPTSLRGIWYGIWSSWFSIPLVLYLVFLAFAIYTITASHDPVLEKLKQETQRLQQELNKSPSPTGTHR